MGTDPLVTAPDAKRIWTIPAGTNFLQALARTLADETGLKDNPAALADALIYVPNRRSAKELAFQLYLAAGKAAILPPEIRTLGDLESEDAPPGAETALADIPPPLSSAKRLGELSRLVRAFYAGGGKDIPATSAIAAAKDLARLLDQAALSEDLDWAELPNLAADHDLAGHWVNAVTFLEIITRDWLAFVDKEQELEPLARRLKAAEALAQQWQSAPPTGLVMIAGSTGATPASQTLIRGAAGLPFGRVVLPGLDTDALPDAWGAIGETVSHPQNALASTLNLLGLAAQDIEIWPDTEGDAKAAARRRLLHEALAPAEQTADWRARLIEMSEDSGVDVEGFAADALDGLTVIETADEASEADVAALLMRETLERDGETAALVTPDAGLARRVSALLQRWDVEVPPSAGLPLGRTRTGSLIGLVAAWSLDPGDPVALAAMLKHPFIKTEGDAAALDKFFLRGARRWDGLEDLAALIEERSTPEAEGGKGQRFDQFTSEQADGAIACVKALSAAATANIVWTDADIESDPAAIIDAMSMLAADVCGKPLPWAGEDGAAASRLIESLKDMTAELGALSPRDIAELIQSESTVLTVSDERPEHPRLAIWGPLEARLQSADRIILAGLNEEVWPRRAAPDAFLPRRFREPLGLIDPEDRLGLAAHDFAQLACAPSVIMLHAARRDDAPAVASRWIWRLKTLAGGAGAEAKLAPAKDADPRDWARALRRRTPRTVPEGFAEPKPSPPLSARPKRLSVTRINTLQRDPYNIYAESILRLSPLDLLGEDVGPNVRGEAVHAALEDFEEDGAEKSLSHLMHLLHTSLIEAGEPEEAWAGRKAVWRQTAEWYLDWRAGHIEGLVKLKTEQRGELDLIIAGEPFTLSAVADRIERRSDDTLTIIDFKTGSPPSPKTIYAAFDQQMPLQALMAREGAFTSFGKGDVGELIYIAFKAKPDTQLVGAKMPEPMTAAELAERAEIGLKRLITEYRDPAAVFLSSPRPQFAGYGTYDRLARRAEWASDVGAGEGGGT